MNYKGFLSQLQTIVPHNQARAELSLIFEYFGLTLKDFLLEKSIKENILNSIQNIITKRINDREPIQYILGHAYFMDEKFIVSPDTLIPRPETEILVEEVCKLPADKILDIGTGTGCIAIMIQKITKKSVIATDINKKALEIAKKNAKNLNTQVDFIHSNLFENIFQKFDIIVSNPPYIPFDTALEEEVLKEPHNALFADEQGLYFYKKIIQNAPQYLNLKGILAFEIGHNQADYIKEFLIQNNFSNIKIIKDLSGFDRIIMAQIL